MTDSTWNFPDNAPTHGGPRPGAGRKHLDGTPPGRDAADPSERHTVTMPASMWEVVKGAGGGTYSVGLRMVVEEWIQAQFKPKPPPKPETRLPNR